MRDLFKLVLLGQKRSVSIRYMRRCIEGVMGRDGITLSMKSMGIVRYLKLHEYKSQPIVFCFDEQNWPVH